jgi:hypothetical protein
LGRPRTLERHPNSRSSLDAPPPLIYNFFLLPREGIAVGLTYWMLSVSGLTLIMLVRATFLRSR